MSTNTPHDPEQAPNQEGQPAQFAADTTPEAPEAQAQAPEAQPEAPAPQYAPPTSTQQYAPPPQLSSDELQQRYGQDSGNGQSQPTPEQAPAQPRYAPPQQYAAPAQPQVPQQQYAAPQAPRPQYAAPQQQYAAPAQPQYAQQPGQYPQQGYAPQQPYAPQGQGYPPQYAYTPVPPRGKSMAGMILGISSILLWFLPVIPIVGLVFSILGFRTEPAGKGMAIAGLIMNGIVLGIWALVLVFAVIGSLTNPYYW